MSHGRIAGHMFNSLDICSCGRKWLDLQHVDKSYLDLPGLAHYGNLSMDEILEIEDERVRRQRRFEEAMSEVGS